jgi:hypothetical protein
MNGKAILAMLEKHIEKGIIAIAAIFLLAMIWFYGINTPNKVAFNGAEHGPRDLNQAVLNSARELENAMRSAKAEEVKQQSSARKLVDAHNEGIFAALTPTKAEGPEAKGFKLTPVPRTLMAGGKEAVVPGLTEAEEATASIELVTPLPPEQPVVAFGRSLAVRKPVRLGDTTARPGPAAAGRDEKAGDPTEVAWASIAAYWPKDAQRTEMTQKGYAAYRSKVYVSGIEVERQELLASGEWSEAKLVEGSQAMPELKIPEPAIDDRGALVNKPELDEAFRVVRAEQNMVIQAPFYTVTAGDDWKLPPLGGHVEADDEGGEPKAPKTPKTPTPRQIKPPVVRGPTPPPIGVSRGGIGGGSDVIGGGGGRESGPGGPGGGAAGDRKEAEKAKKQAKDDLKEGRELLAKKDYGAAASKFQAVMSNQHASSGDKKQAEGELEKAQKKLADASTPNPGRPGSDTIPDRSGTPTVMEDMGGRSEVFTGRPGMAAAVSPVAGAAAPLVTHPDRNLPAVFYHDDTVESGKTYRYRTRVDLWNRYVGRIKSLKDPAGARQAVLRGEWSLWSEPVTITPQTHFYVNSLKPGTDRVSVEVWKWIKGKWVKRNVEAGVGEVIGGEFALTPKERGEEAASDGDKKTTAKVPPEDFSTKAVVLDIRVEQPVKVRQNKGKGQFEYRDQKSLVLVYLDPADGQVKERIQAFDTNDPLRKKLKEQAGEGS